MSTQGIEDLLKWAERTVVEGESPTLPSITSPFFARQALQLALSRYWKKRGFPEMAGCSARAQLICLHEYLGDESLAGQISHLWWALSRACHHHPYKLPLNVREVRRSVETTKKVVAALGESAVTH